MEEKWIASALGSIDGIKPAVPREAIYERVMQRIELRGPGITIEMISSATLYRVAAAILLIVTLNVYTCLRFSANNNSAIAGASAFARDYSLVNNSYNY